MSSNAAASAKGDSFRAEGEKALKRTLIFGFGKTQKFEDAAEAFVKAGNAYKLANLWQSAGDCFLQAADSQSQLGAESIGHHDIAAKLIEAANCYKKISPVDAVSAFRRAIDLYNDAGRFGTSARYYKEMAEVFEADNNTEMAMESYQQAADLFSSDNKKSNANQCLLKEIGNESMQSNLGKFSAKGYFLQSLLCHLAQGDAVQVTVKLDQCKNADYTFGSLEGSNSEAFSQACADFDPMLLKAKKHIADLTGEGDAEGGAEADGDVDLS
eukprot:gene26855-35547_t